MAVVLRREELILRRERTVDLANVDDAPVGAGDQDHVLGHVGEGHERLALCERRQRPFRQTQDAEPGRREAAFENFPTRVLSCHDRPLQAQQCP